MSVANNGIASVSTVAPAAIGGEHHGEELRVEKLFEQCAASAAPQKSKLIILRMTKMPIDIQMRAAGQHHAAERIGPQQLDVLPGW